jgi:hypothetical protein
LILEHAAEIEALKIRIAELEEKLAKKNTAMLVSA